MLCYVSLTRKAKDRSVATWSIVTSCVRMLLPLGGLFIMRSTDCVYTGEWEGVRGKGDINASEPVGGLSF